MENVKPAVVQVIPATVMVTVEAVSVLETVAVVVKFLIRVSFSSIMKRGLLCGPLDLPQPGSRPCTATSFQVICPLDNSDCGTITPSTSNFSKSALA